LRKDYYFAKNIGLLKFSIKTPNIDSTWSILRWHIVQQYSGKNLNNV